MSARDEAVKLIDEMLDAAQEMAISFDPMPGASDAGRRYNAARARLLALLASEPEPSEAEIEAASISLCNELDSEYGPWWKATAGTQSTWRAAATNALAAAQAARQTGGAE